MRRNRVILENFKKYALLFFVNNKNKEKKGMSKKNKIIVAVVLAFLAFFAYKKFSTIGYELKSTPVVNTESKTVEESKSEAVVENSTQIPIEASSEPQEAIEKKKVNSFEIDEKNVSAEEFESAIKNYTKNTKDAIFGFAIDNESKEIFLSIDGMNYKSGDDVQYSKNISIENAQLVCGVNQLPKFSATIIYKKNKEVIQNIETPFELNKKITFLFDAITILNKNKESIFIEGDVIAKGFKLVGINEVEGTNDINYEFICNGKNLNLKYKELTEVSQ